MCLSATYILSFVVCKPSSSNAENQSKRASGGLCPPASLPAAANPIKISIIAWYPLQLRLVVTNNLFKTGKHCLSSQSRGGSLDDNLPQSSSDHVCLVLCTKKILSLSLAEHALNCNAYI
jgi:hypothetical protein